MTNTTVTTKRRKQQQPATKQFIGINVLIPTALHKRLRLKQIQNGLTMSEAVEAALREWLR